jgi:hypothetical protein
VKLPSLKSSLSPAGDRHCLLFILCSAASARKNHLPGLVNLNQKKCHKTKTH